MFCVLQNSGRSTSGILARPLPKGAGLRQGSIVSNISIFSDTRNVQITQNLSAVKAEGSPPRLSSLPQTPPTPHYPSPRTTQNPNLPPAAVTTIIHHSLFIIHYSLNKKSAPFQTTDLDIKFQCKIKVCRPPVTQLSPISNNRNGEFEAAHCHPPVTQLSPIGNNKNGEFTVAFSHTANLKRVAPARRNLKRHIAAVSGDSPLPPQPRCALLKMLSVGCTRLCKRRSR